MKFVTPYKSPVWRLLYNMFVQTPALLWFKFLSWPLPQNELSPNGAVLLPAWKAAQQNIATNPVPSTYSGGTVYASDKRALSVQPKGVTVIVCPDEPIENLVKLDPAWAHDKDPSGTILMPSGLNSYTTCHSFTICGKHARVYCAASEMTPANLQYEFENVILARLGYDVSAR